MAKIEQQKQAELSMPLIGRRDELVWLISKLDDLKQGHSKTIVVEGEAGIGKSKLVESFMESVQQQKIAIILGKGRSIEDEIPYRAWQDILNTYFNLINKDNVDPIEQQQIVQTQVSNDAPDLAMFTPLLNHILHLDFADNETTKTLGGTSRLEGLHKLILTLLDTWLVANPLVLIIEDGQWVDSFSWDLIIELAQTHHHLPLLLVVVTRPLEGETIQTLSKLDNTEHLILDLMLPGDTVTLAVSGLGLNSNELPETVANLVRVRASGNPFFAEEMFYYLYDNGYITFKSIADKTRCLVNGDLSKAAQTLPATIQNLSIHIPAGDTAAIVGPTGSGKSTLAKLLRRFYDVQ